MTRWTATDIPSQSGRVAIVTGANSGIGLETARELARAGAQVVIASRDLAKAKRAQEDIAATVPGARLETRELDLASLDSVRRFAAAIEKDHPTVDLLINNAGVMMTPRRTTADGFELQLGTNHLGHFALTGLLLPRLAAGRDPRVVTVSSLEHRPGKIDFDDLQSERGYGPRRAYQQSKFANAVFALELDRRLRASGSPVKSLFAHPGWTATNLQTTGPTGAMRGLLKVGNALLAQKGPMGALPTLNAATAPDLDSGTYIGPDGFKEMRGYPTVVQPVSRARDAELGRRLWQVSEELTGVRFLQESKAA